MYPTSQRWKESIYRNVQCVVNVYIDNVMIDPTYILDLRKGGNVFEEELALGSTPSQYIEMKIYKAGLPQTHSKIRIEYGILVNNSLTVKEIDEMLVGNLDETLIQSIFTPDSNFEIIPLGIYNVDSFTDNYDNTLTIKALDNMIKFDSDDGYYDASELINTKGYATLAEIAQDICNKKGVELGSTSFFNSDKQVSLYDNSYTARQYIGMIAEIAGCFAFIGRDGKLYFREIYQDETEISIDYFTEPRWGEEYQITKVVYENGTINHSFGDDSGNTLWISQDNLYVDEDVVQNIYNKMKDFTANSFTGRTIIDPAIDIGDKLIIDEKPVIYQGEMSFNMRFIAEIGSSIQIKNREETTTKKESQKVINRRVRNDINLIEGRIEQVVEETTENTSKISEHTQSINEIKNGVENVETLLEEETTTIKNRVETIENSTNYAITVTEEMQINGVSKVRTETGYTFDKDGLTVSKEGAETKTILNELGLSVKDATGSEDENLLFAGYNEETGETIVKSKNMTIEKMIKIGANTLIKDFEDELGLGTGVFWIGE